jgi:hypothetical protein
MKPAVRRCGAATGSRRTACIREHDADHR